MKKYFEISIKIVPIKNHDIITDSIGVGESVNSVNFQMGVSGRRGIEDDVETY